MIYAIYQVHLYAHTEPVQGCPWCGPWIDLRSIELKDPRR